MSTVVLLGTVTLGLGAIAALPMFGMRAMTVTSGSMEPEIGVGATVIVEQVDPDTISVRDIITYAGGTTGGATTHRVLALHRIDDGLWFQTQGDANDTPDVDLTSADAVIGRARFDVPHAGRVLTWSQHPAIRYVMLGAFSSWLLAKNTLVLVRAVRRGSGPQPGQVTAAIVLIGLASTGVAAQPRDTTGALFVDSITVPDNQFSTGTW